MSDNAPSERAGQEHSGLMLFRVVMLSMTSATAVLSAVNNWWVVFAVALPLTFFWGERLHRA